MTLRETLERVRGLGVPVNEQTTITQIIVPILMDLGWPVDTISREHWVGGRKEGGKVDIALMEGNRCVCVVEAKRPGVNLVDHVDQVLRYAFYEGTFCILTDGLEWRLCLPRESGNPEERQFALLRLREDPVEQIANDFQKFLSRSAVVSGEAEQNAVNALKQLREEQKRLKRESDIARELSSIWRKMLTEPDKELVARVESRVHTELGFSPSADQVAEFLAATIELSQSDFHDRIEGFGPRFKDPMKALTRSTEIVGATVLGVHERVTSWTGLVVFAAEQMYDRHPYDFLERTRDFKGPKRDYVSKDTSNMTNPREIRSSGIFVEAGWSGHIECERQSRRLLYLFGYPESALQIYYSDSDLQVHDSCPSPRVRQRGITGATLFGTDRSLRSAIELLDFVAVQLYERHGQDLLDRVAQISGRKIQISRNPSDIDRPRQTGAPGVFIDRNLTIAGIKARSYEWLRLFGYPDSALQIHER